MDSGIWNRLNLEQQSAVKSLSSTFIKAVQVSDAKDGWEFSQQYSIVLSGDTYIISNGINHLSGISHSDKAVMEALMTDACQNYGR